MSPAQREQLSVLLILGTAGAINFACWIGVGYVVWGLLR